MLENKEELLDKLNDETPYNYSADIIVIVLRGIDN